MANFCSVRLVFSPEMLLATSKTLIPIVSRASPPTSFCKPYPSLQIHCYSASDSSSTSPLESHQSPAIVFVKGLPLSTTEGRLKKAFSQFGEVKRVKIVSDKRTKQPLGYGFVWLTSEESAQVAVKEMDGKFFDGRFIFVTISKPGLCKS